MKILGVDNKNEGVTTTNTQRSLLKATIVTHWHRRSKKPEESSQNTTKDTTDDQSTSSERTKPTHFRLHALGNTVLRLSQKLPKRSKTFGKKNITGEKAEKGIDETRFDNAAFPVVLKQKEDNPKPSEEENGLSTNKPQSFFNPEYDSFNFQTSQSDELSAN